MFDRVCITAMSCTHNGLGKIITRKNGRKRAVFYRIARKPQNWINSLLDRDLILLAICTISTRNGLERRLKLWSNSLRNLSWFPLYLRSHFFSFFQYEVSHMSWIGRKNEREREKWKAVSRFSSWEHCFIPWRNTSRNPSLNWLWSLFKSHVVLYYSFIFCVIYLKGHEIYRPVKNMSKTYYTGGRGTFSILLGSLAL